MSNQTANKWDTHRLIDGLWVPKTQSQTAKAKVASKWDTHKLVNGLWVPKTQSQTAPAPAKPAPKATPAPVASLRVDGKEVFTSRRDCLRAIEVAAAKVLLDGSDSEAIESIRRGRLGGRKDNLASLNALLSRYRGVVS